MILSAIFAVSENNVIGKDNDLPWYLPADLKYFKKTTLGRPVIMGRKSYESIGRPLPKRSNIVVTRDRNYASNGISIVHSLEEAFTLAKKENTEEAFVIGGAKIYAAALPHCDRIYMTLVHEELDGDTFLPDLDLSEWSLISEEKHEADEKNIYDYTFRVYERI